MTVWGKLLGKIGTISQKEFEIGAKQPTLPGE